MVVAVEDGEAFANLAELRAVRGGKKSVSGGFSVLST